MRSANVPETIDAAVATKTIWKNQSDIDEYVASLRSAELAASFPASVAFKSANSALDGL